MKCEKVPFGSYLCYADTSFGACVDKCLLSEIEYLHSVGVETIGCCCGHKKKKGYIQVDPLYCGKMNDLGYEILPVDENGNGLWCYIPKSNLNEGVDAQ